VPYRQNPFTDLLYPTKAFEYIVMGVPAILARTGAVVELFGDIPDMFFQPEDAGDLAACILALYEEPHRRRDLLEAERHAYRPYTWESQRERYIAQLDQVIARQRAIPNLEAH
ncbi:MAG: hypothetical protein D6791_19025, partial [Chloroflexi bacterium]